MVEHHRASNEENHGEECGERNKASFVEGIGAARGWSIFGAEV